jgi:hypothetical protein
LTLGGAQAGGGALSFAIEAPPVHGHLVGEAPALTYTPADGFTGPDIFTFTASNGVDTSRPAEVRIEVTPATSDTTPPRVVWTNPGDGREIDPVSPKPIHSDAVGPIWGPPLVAEFSESLEAASVVAGAVRVIDTAGREVPSVVLYDAAARQVAVHLRERWRATTYTVTVTTGITDLAGNHLAAPYTWSFTARPPGSIRERVWSVP